MSAPIANTTLGLVAGTWLNDGTAQYLGLQYATADRWHEPVDRSDPYAASGDTFDATRFGMSCPQGPGQIYNSSATSEDCLYINVWTPPQRHARVTPPSVMLWIHGGAYSFGGGAPFNGSALAAQHGVTVCTINYRLGYLGWLAFPEDRGRSTTGNWGLLDQQSALRWVQREVLHFGGNPSSVTIFGQSAGASCVIRHLASPASHRLFHQAIAESGAARGDFSLDFALTKTLDAARRLGCAGSFAKPTLRDCLSDRRVEDILSAQAAASTPPPSHPLVDAIVSPVVDGFTLLDDTRSVLQRGTVADAPLLIGANTNESNLFVATAPAYANMSAAQYAGFVNYSLYLRNRTPPPGRLARILAAFPPSSDPKLNLQRYADFVTDAGFVCAARQTAAALRRRRLSPSAVYFYHYDHPFPDLACTDVYFDPLQFGTTHTAEISYVFGRPTYVFGRPLHPERCAFNASEAAFSRQVGGYWASFARDGKPSADWPLWEPPGTGGDADALVKLKRVERSGALDAVEEAPIHVSGLEIEHGWRAAKCAEVEAFDLEAKVEPRF